MAGDSYGGNDPYQVKPKPKPKPKDPPKPKPKPKPKPTTPPPTDTPATTPPPTDTPATTPPATLPRDPGTPPTGARGRAQYDMLASWLSSLGLGDLFTVNPDGTPGGWLWERMQTGIDTEAELQVAIESTDQWKTRFAVIVEQRALAAQGQAVRPMSVQEVVAYEQMANQLFRQAGLPPSFYDHYTDFQSLMVNQVSTQELQQRVEGSMAMVRNTPPEVRQAFSEFYGIGADESALAAFFLDPTKSLASLDRAARSSYAAGFGQTLNLTMNQTTAERIADSPLGEGAIFEGLTSAAELAPLAQETWGDSTNIDDTSLLESTFFGNADAKRELERRLRTRQSANREAVGGAILTERGAAVGSA